MNWIDFLGHEEQRSWFENAVAQSRLASTFLFVGPEGIGKRTFATIVAKSMLCHNRKALTIEPCGFCESCVQVEANTHPDLLKVSKPPEASALSIDLLVGTRANRLRDGICYELHMTPFNGKRRIAIIDDADTIQVEAANSMLKTLEEPPASAMIFLIGTNEQRQLPTIRSRCQVVRFQPLSEKHVLTLVKRLNLVEEEQHAEAVSKLSEGSMVTAAILSDVGLRNFREDLFRKLSQRSIAFVQLATDMQQQLKGLDEEGALRRKRLKLLLGFAVEFYRSQLFKNATTRSARALAYCLSVQSEVDKNLTPAGLIESWAAELAEICST